MTDQSDAFVSSMTFASGDFGCDCGDCECGPPAAIREAVGGYLRKRKLERASAFDGSKRIHVRQSRNLVRREGGFSVWRLDLPVDGGDPIVEYRNSHRILFVKRMDKASRIYSIGKGIIGSAAEENGRERVNWEEGGSYLLPCSKGIACGWVHKMDTEGNNETGAIEENNSARIDDVILYSLKVSPEILKGAVPEETSCWVKKSFQLFLSLEILHNSGNEGSQRSAAEEGQVARRGIPLSDEKSLMMELIVGLAQ